MAKRWKMVMAVVCAVLMMPFAHADAQNTETAYFLERNMNRHDMNPAFGNDRNYVAIPFLGNLNIGLGGNLGLKDVLYVRNGKTVTFMHPDVTLQDVMKNVNMDGDNKLNQELKMQLLAFGFKGGKGYTTFEMNLREDVRTIIPGSFFDAAKSGLTNKRYDVKDLNAHAGALAEVAVGHSHAIGEKLRVGAKAKVLVGVGIVDMSLEDAYLEFDGDSRFSALANGTVLASVNGLKIEKDRNGAIEDYDVDEPGIGGMGFALDLGAEYKINEQFTVSAALIDLGFIKWKNNHVGRVNGSVSSDDYVFDMEDGTYVNARGEEIGDAFDAFDVKYEGDKGARSTGLGATLNVGAEYKAPFYDKLSFGLLNTTRIQGKYSWTDFRLSANLSPTKWFGAAASVSAGTYGANVGWVIDIHPKGVGFFVAMDKIMGKMSKEFVPLSSNAEISFGMNVIF